jgi:5-carboxymethyl-2-hydroxymuconate isomerase
LRAALVRAGSGAVSGMSRKAAIGCSGRREASGDQQEEEPSMISRVVVFIASAAMAMLATGCATRATSIDAQWVSPAIASKGKVQTVLVVGALRDSTHRRMLEDSMTQALTTAGVKAVPSHRFLADSAEVSEAQLRGAVAAAGASHVLISSVSGRSTDVRVTQGMVMGPGWGPGWGWPHTMGPGWGGMASYHSMAWRSSMTTDVRTTERLHGDTRLFDARSSEVVWSAATTTVTGWDSVAAMIDQYTRLMVDTLKKDAVI